ncbi:MAG: hypothetical protein DWQ34_03885 [Planctomycetota bacterium]|nr:MAG: hypothetical protein DWQ29_10660 [Planctomycetota bacterium]REJ96386.1 MAG: hypothetical protein DWQ34_03885 [Planctomycetota bacterium]REK29657.1 MAG: hypothetical protein DWQ41_03190 [Planctomycetota bacterium]REK30523.1 MAG: hypothetical protein DWQ45_21845 [Planctomycetota bacterium]
MSTIASAKPKFHVNDKVAFTFGMRRVKGFVVEDRGPLGVGGRRIYRVRLDMDPFDSMYFELPEDDLVEAPEPEPPLTNEEIAEYLARGGLLLMLRSQQCDQTPRVWLKRNNLGNVTHTFVEERGLAGGAALPQAAFADKKVIAGKRAEAKRFIMSFGLSEDEANAVIDEIGTKP